MTVEVVLFILMSCFGHDLLGRPRSHSTNQQAGHELVFITSSPLYDSQPWLCEQLPDFSFCCTASDSERLWLRGSIRDQPEESLFDGWDQQSPSEPANNTCILSVKHKHTHTQTDTHLLTWNNSYTVLLFSERFSERDSSVQHLEVKPTNGKQKDYCLA